MFPRTASVQDIQRKYRTLFDVVITTKKPLIVLNNNKAEVVIVEVHQFEEMQEKAEQYDLEMAKKAIAIYATEKKKGKLKKLKSLANLTHDY